MKIVARIFGACVILLLSIMTSLEMMSMNVRQDELNNVISNAVTSTQIIMRENIEDTYYGTDNSRLKISSNDDYIKTLKAFVDKSLSTNSDYQIKVYGVDYQKGLLDIELVTKYQQLNGSTRVLSARKSNIIDMIIGDTVANTEYNLEDTFSYSKGFDYTGDIQVFTTPKSGYYRIEAWGASSGASLNNGVYTLVSNSVLQGVDDYADVGYGGYSSGVILLENGEELYLAVGGMGENGVYQGNANGGWNGGGSGSWDHNDNEALAGGGGASSITTSLSGDGTLKNYINIKDRDVIMVAGGGGSGFGEYSSVGHGGGATGGKGGYSPVSSDKSELDGGSQDSGYRFGQGADAVRNTVYFNSEVGAGGGGWYGGYSITDLKDDVYINGSGGSGYIGSSRLKNKYMAGYHAVAVDDEQTRTVSTNTYSDQAVSNCAKLGNGYIRITYIREVDNQDQPLFVLSDDKDGNGILSTGDILAATDSLYGVSDSTMLPRKYVIISAVNDQIEVMATDAFVTAGYGGGSKSFANGSNHKGYADSDLDVTLNTLFYNQLSSATHNAMVEKKIVQHCYKVVDNQSDAGDSYYTGTELNDSNYYVSDITANEVGSRFVYALDVKDIAENPIDLDGKTINSLIHETESAVDHKILLCSADNSTFDVLCYDANTGKVKAVSNSASLPIHPVFTINKGTVSMFSSSWGGSLLAPGETYVTQLDELGYMPLEYIEADGQQWIDTGITTKENTWITMDFSVMNSSSASYLGIFGTWDSVSAGTKNGNLVITHGGTKETSAAISDNTVYRLSFGQGNIRLDNTLLRSSSASNNTSSQHLLTFANDLSDGTDHQPNQWDSANGYGCGRIYSIKVYESTFDDTSEDALVHYLLPAVSRSGAVGLYDTVTKTFYPFQGDGNYSVGGLVEKNDIYINLTLAERTREYNGQALQAIVTSRFNDTSIYYSTDQINWSTQSPSITDSGSLTVYVKAENPKYDTVEGNYTLNVTPKELLVTTDELTAFYTGNPYSKADSAHVSGLIEGESVSIRSTTSVTEGSERNEYSIDWTGAKQVNYRIVESLGTINVIRTISLNDVDGNGKVSKGDTLLFVKEYLYADGNTGPTEFLVLNTNGSDVELLATENYQTTKFNTSSVAVNDSAGKTVQKYEDSTLDTLLNTTYFNSLSDIVKGKIKTKSITQNTWQVTTGTLDNPDATVTGFRSTYKYKKTGTVGTYDRKVYALDVEDVKKYLGDTFTGAQLNKMFFNTESGQSGKYVWLRSANCDRNSGAFDVIGSNGYLYSDGFSSTSEARPAFTITLD